MAVGQRVITQIDGLETLRQLLTIKTSDVIEAHEEARKQMALTEAQEAQLASDKELMASAAKFTQEIGEREAALAKAKDEHVANIRAFNQEADRQRNELKETALDLDAKDKDITAHVAVFENAKKQFEKAKQDHEFQMKQREATLQRTMEETKQWEERIGEEARRLAALRQSLDKKAKAVADALGD